MFTNILNEWLDEMQAKGDPRFDESQISALEEFANLLDAQAAAQSEQADCEHYWVGSANHGEMARCSKCGKVI